MNVFGYKYLGPREMQQRLQELDLCPSDHKGAIDDFLKAELSI